MPGLLDIIAVLWFAASPLGDSGLAASLGGNPETGLALSGESAELLALSDDELLTRLESDASSLGSLSIGAPSKGLLFNAVALEPEARWEIAPRAESWGTAETIAAVRLVIDTVHELFPDTPPIFIGDISSRGGGRLKRHQTHQGGRDVDFGFYYKEGKGGWYARGTASNLDLPRNWALLRALITRTDVEAVLLDARIQRLLYAYALGIGEDEGWLKRVFQVPKGNRESLVRHVALHHTHYHVRFHNAVAQELGRRVHPLMVQLKILDPPSHTVRHIVRAGQTLGSLAARFGTTVRAIMQANGLKTARLRAGRAYHIPVRAVASATEPFVVPRRLLPPSTPEPMSPVLWPTHESLYGEPPEQ